MSKARLVITAVLIEGRSQSQVARDYGVSQSWISRLIARYTLEGDAAFEPRSRRQSCLPVFSATGLFEDAGIDTWATDEFQTRAQCRAVTQYSVVSQSAESTCGQ